MASVGTMYPIHGARARRMALALGFAVTAALGALSATLFAEATVPAPRVATPPAGVRMALYVQTQSWSDVAQAAPGVRRLHLEMVLVNAGRGSAPAPVPQDFTLRAADGRTWHVSPGTPDLSDRALQPGEQRGLDLFVDLPAPVPQPELTMQYDGQFEAIPLLS